MSFKATLSIDGGEETRLLHCSYALQRDFDSTGRPSSMVHGGTIDFTIESTDDNSLFEWMVDQFSHKKGKATFFKRDSNTKMKEVSFEDGYIVKYSEAIDAIGESPMVINFTVSAKKISVAGATHENPWPKS